MRIWGNLMKPLLGTAAFVGSLLAIVTELSIMAYRDFKSGYIKKKYPKALRLINKGAQPNMSKSDFKELERLIDGESIKHKRQVNIYQFTIDKKPYPIQKEVRVK